MKVTSKAKKDKRPGYAMVLKLMPLIFATEEMANSRGQGLKPAKDGDLKPVLDAEKMKAIKTYAEGFCKKKGLTPSTDAEMNIAVTEAVAYARKKLKKKL